MKIQITVGELVERFGKECLKNVLADLGYTIEGYENDGWRTYPYITAVLLLHLHGKKDKDPHVELAIQAYKDELLPLLSEEIAIKNKIIKV